MKKLFIHARSQMPIDLPVEDIRRLPQPVGVITSIQYLDRIDSFVEAIQGLKAGQVLGCDTRAAERISGQVGCFLFIGSGRFHALGVAQRTDKAVFCFDPCAGVLSRIDDSEVQACQKARDGAFLKFLSSEQIGVLVSTKSGQEKLDEALAFKRACKDKEVTIFLFETLSHEYLDNFTFIESWVNTACPRIPETFGPGIINLGDLLSRCPQYGVVS